jgi:hypothetical protein
VKVCFKRFLFARIACIGIFIAVLLSAQAIPINGGIQFSGSAHLNNSPGSATEFTGFYGPGGLGGSPVVMGGSQTGIYSFVPAGTSVNWFSFDFGSPLAANTILWSFQVNGITCSFEATSVTIAQRGPRSLNILVNGIARMDGYEDTEGVWKIVAVGGNSTVTFGAATRISGVPTYAPDTGSSIWMFMLAIFGLALAGFKRFRVQAA